MLNTALIRWTGLGSIAGGIAWMALWILFLLTHGPGPEDRKGTMFLLTSLDYSKFAVVPVVLFTTGLAGLQSQQKDRSGYFGRAGLAIAQVGFAIMAVSLALSLWPIPWGFNADQVDWQTPLTKYGSILVSLSSVVVSVGIIFFAIGILKARVWPAWVLLLLVLGQLAAVPWLYMTPWGGLTALAWLLVGCALCSKDRRARYGAPSFGVVGVHAKL